MQRGYSGHAAPGPIFGRAFRQTLIGSTFPNRNSVSLKSDIVSKQCPCMPLDRERRVSVKVESSFGRERMSAKDGGASQKDRTKSSLTSIKKASLTTHL
jgi:hypothetical protein